MFHPAQLHPLHVFQTHARIPVVGVAENLVAILENATQASYITATCLVLAVRVFHNVRTGHQIQQALEQSQVLNALHFALI